MAKCEKREWQRDLNFQVSDSDKWVEGDAIYQIKNRVRRIGQEIKDNKFSLEYVMQRSNIHSNIIICSSNWAQLNMEI